jgi:ribonucleotide reductase alpha subunit
MTDVTFAKLTSLHFYAWKKGLKTGMYYLRTRAATDAVKFTVDAEAVKKAEQLMCSIKNKEACVMCSG